ncbi:MAG: family 1 glycosylhydrolase, partial [Vulcanimicrobiaceae bacterium]
RGEHPSGMQPTFRFGVATADHQCEAYTGQDDIRDLWERARGLTPRGRATDFWNRYREDADLAEGLGCRAFRLSLSWARLEPEPGKWDDAAFAHYRDVLAYLREKKMATVVTLHHNTWPLHVEAAGGGAGMLDARFPARMEAYASEAARRLGDLIDYYVTINEPNQLVYGYIKGFWMRAYPMPPGLEPHATGEQQMGAVLQLIPNLFRAHARMRAAIHKERPGALVGTNPLILGLPRWLQRLADRNATHLRSPEQAQRQAGRISQHRILESGEVDLSIAQLTMTPQRMGHALFSEPYLVAHLAALHPVAVVLPASFEDWKGRVGVTAGSATAAQAAGRFPDAELRFFRESSEGVAALQRGELDLVFDDDVILAPYAAGDLTLTRLRGKDQRFAVAIAFGSRALLDAVDRVLRGFKHPGANLPPAQAGARDLDKSLQNIRKRGVLRVGIHPGVEGLCMPDGAGGYRGLEPDLARRIAAHIFGSERARVRFVPLRGERRLSATRSPLQLFDGLRKSFAIFSTLLGTNWWNLGLAGKLPHFLCPAECAGTLDYVGLDYYWGVPSVWPGELHRLFAAAECRYANAPVWPNVLDSILREAQEQFPGKPIVVVENGCVTSADGVSRAAYLEKHVAQVRRALERGVPIEAYLCWSITSNREWGLPFDDDSDFGLFHIDLDRDPNLTRVPTEASARYAQIIASASTP